MGHSANSGRKDYQGENRIARLSYEVGIGFPADGSDPFEETQEDEGSVSLSREQWEKLKDGVFTHNHPNGLPFSKEDLNALANWELAEIRAVTKSGTFSLRRTVRNENAYSFGEEYENSIRRFMERVTDPKYKEISSRYNSGKITHSSYGKEIDRLNGMVEKERIRWLKKYSKEYGYKFKIY